MNAVSKVISNLSSRNLNAVIAAEIAVAAIVTLTDEEIEKTEPMLFDLAFDFQMDYGVDISIVVKNKDQFEYWLGALPFYNNVKKEGIVL